MDIVKVEPRWTGTNFHVLTLVPADGSVRTFSDVVNVQVGVGCLFFVETDPNYDLNVQHCYPLGGVRHWTVTRGEPLGTAGGPRPTAGRVGT